MPLKAILREVKYKWGVDVNNCQMYRATRLAKDKILGKVELQYNMLWVIVKLLGKNYTLPQFSIRPPMV
jgi:hypothetical protein